MFYRQSRFKAVIVDNRVLQYWIKGLNTFLNEWFQLLSFFTRSKYLWTLVAALQKGRVGKGHLQEKNEAEEEDRRKT